MISKSAIIERFTHLSPNAKNVFLASLSHKLTICARDTYDPASEAVLDPGRLKAFNEVQHKILGQLLGSILGQRSGRPDEMFIEMLINMCEELGCLHIVEEVQR